MHNRLPANSRHAEKDEGVLESSGKKENFLIALGEFNCVLAFEQHDKSTL